MDRIKRHLWALIILSLALVPVHAQEITQDTVHANGLKRLGDAQMSRRVYDSAASAYDEAVKIYEQYSDQLPVQYGECLYLKGRALHFGYHDNQALANYLKSMEVLDPVLDAMDELRADLYNGLGGIYIDLGYRVKAKPYLDKSLAIESELNGPESIGAAITNYNLGLVNMYFGESFTAIRHFMSALPAYIREYGENGQHVAQLYTNVGILHRDIGEFDVAEAYFKRGIEIHMHNHGAAYWNLAYPYTNLAALYESRGEIENALNYFLMARELCRANPERLKRLDAIVSAGLATVYSKLEDYQSAQASIDEAIAHFGKNYYEAHPRFADFYTIKGNIFRKQGEELHASEWFGKSIANTRNAYGDVHPAMARAYESLAQMYFDSGEYDNALDYIYLSYSSLSDTSDKIPAFELVDGKKEYIRLMNLHARVLRKTSRGTEIERLEESEELFGRAAAAIDRLRQGFLTEESKIFIQENALETYEGAVECLARLADLTGDKSYLQRAFAYFEKSKSTVLSESIQSSRVFAAQGVPPGLLDYEEQINREIRGTELKFRNEENDSLRQIFKQALFTSRVKADSLSVVIKTNWPDYFELKYQTEVIEARKVMNALGGGTAMLTILQGDSTWYILALTAKDIQLSTVVSFGQEPLAEFMRYIKDPFSKPEDYLKAGNEIYRKFVQQPLEGLQGIHSLVIVPDGTLYHLPFDALSVSADSPDYLIKKYSTRYINSASLQWLQVDEVSYEERYMGFAPAYASNSGRREPFRSDLMPLMGNKEEVTHAGNMFNGKVFTDMAATEEAFSNQRISSRIIHLAMHAQTDDQDPMSSGLWFAQSADSLNDGYLNAYEIYDLDIRSQLVVLSACNTGTGEIRRGEGVMSLSRAFMYAGCPNIVMSLWRASDQASSEIMQSFFTKLSDARPKQDALRLAKLDYLENADPVQAHPAYWASFILVGDNTPVATRTNALPIIILCLLLAALIYGILRRYRTG